MATNTLSANFSSDIALYIAKKTLSIALKRLVFYQLADKVQLPKNSGRTFQYTRYERLVLPQAKISEGVTPTGIQMSISSVQAVMDQWGSTVVLSDVSIDSVKHPVLQIAIERMGTQAQETLDRELTKVALSGATVYYPGSITARASITSTSYLDSPTIGKTVANLRANGAMPYSEDLYVGVVDPYCNDDITVDATFVDAAKYGMIKKLLVNEIGEWKGVRWVRSNTVPKLTLLASGSGANSATSGSLSTSTTYNAAVSVVDANTGMETFVSAAFNAATTTGTSVAVTLPSLPAGAPSGSLMNLYFGSNGGTLYLAQSNLAGGAVVNQGTLPTSGQVAPAAPATGFNTHFSVILGKEALGCVELNKIRAYMTPATPSDSDPLVQRRTVGWKADFKSFITNDAFMARIESASRSG